MAQMGQIGIAFHNYEMNYETFPAGVRSETGPILNRAKGLHQSWTIAILPQLDEANLYGHIDPDVSVYDKKHADVANLGLSILVCPSSPAWGGGSSSYAAVHHDSESPIDADNNGVFYLNSKTTRDDISDGLQYTFFLGEKSVDSLNDLGWMSGTRATLRNTGHVIGVTPPVLAPQGSSVKDFSIDPADDPPLEPENDSSNQSDSNGGEQTDSSGSENDAPAEIATDEAANSDAATSDEMAVDPTENVATDDDTTDDGPPDDPTDDEAANRAANLAIEKAVAAGLYVGGFGSDHPGGALFVFGDGSVRFIPQSINMTVYANFGNRADGQLIDSETLR
jgi:hypothetical protein